MTRPKPMAAAPRNKTLRISSAEQARYAPILLRAPLPKETGSLDNRVICGDAAEILSCFPRQFVDLLVLDPPYNLTRRFGEQVFQERSDAEYETWFESWFLPALRVLTPTATVYVCADWRCSGPVQRLLQRHLIVRNRITWEREKGRGAARNWKNASEDIWFCTVSNDYFFDVETVKLKRRVLAPYRSNGQPKDWGKTAEGAYRMTHPSNLWTDLTVPYWSMAENTPHPTQKPEKLIAKLILASSRPGDLVLDPFLGSGTTAVVARKLGRRFIGIEANDEYGCLALKRLESAATNRVIQGYSDGVFWERNSAGMRANWKRPRILTQRQNELFPEAGRPDSSGTSRS